MFGIQFAAAWAGGFHPAPLALVIGNISALQRGLYCTRVHVQRNTGAVRNVCL